MVDIELFWGSPNSQKGPQNHNENGDPGSPKFYDTGYILAHISMITRARDFKFAGAAVQSCSW